MATNNKATKTSKSTSSSGGLKYSDAVKNQGGVATNPQTGAKTYAKGSVPSTGAGNAAIRGDNSELIQDYDPSQSPGVASITPPTPTVSSIESPALQPPTLTVGVITPQEALASAKASGVEPPQSGGEARSAISQFMPAAGNTFYKPQPDSQQVYNAAGQALSYDQYIAQGGKADFSNVQAGLPSTTGMEGQLAQDPIYNEILQAYKEQNDIAVQRDSLMSQYDKMVKQAGIPALNAELLSISNIINGTESDIRLEVESAGGMATNSQVLALASSRNKVLIQRYDQLLATKEMAQQNVNTMIGLASQDRDFAIQTINQKLNILGQISSYRDKFMNNAKEAYNNVISTMGYSGLYNSLGGDPFKVALAERTLGLGAGQLSQLGSMPGERDTQVITANGRSLLIDTQTGETIKDLGGAYKTGSGGGSSGGSGRGGSSSTTLKPTADTASEIKAWILANRRANPDIAYYDLWRQLSDELNNNGLKSSNFDPQFWEVLHPDGLAGYKAQNKNTSSGGNTVQNPF